MRSADRAPLPTADDVRPPGGQGPAPYFTNFVKDQLVAKYGAGRVFGGGLRVTTTIDLDLQLKARAAIERVLRNPDGPAAALVAIEPQTGEVKAMFGGRNFRESQFNLAAQAKRQPGSAFKPIVLAAAMNEGISPVTQLESKPVSIDAGDRIWKVTNYDKTYLGRVSLSRAIVSSDNSVYAQLTDVVGPKAIVRTAHSLGIRSRLAPYFSIGLGSGAVSPLELARAYATLANEGRRVDGSEFENRPRVVRAVERIRSGRIDENAPIPTQVMEESHAELLTDILEDVVQSGTGKRAAIPGREIAGKTGTTDNYGDAWFVGYTPELVVAVWVGYADALRPMLTEFNGDPVAGGTLPAMIWKEFMEKIDEDETRSFDAPPYLGGVSQWVVRRAGEWQLDNGYCRGSRLVAYFSGLGPDSEADCKPNEVSVPLVVGMTEAGAEATLAAQPLGANVVYKPAKPGALPGLVVDQDPRRGGLSAHDDVTVVVAKAQYGLLPNFIGSSVADARREAARLKIRLRAHTAPGREGTVLRQVPAPGVAVAPGLRVRLVVGDGSRS
jgi:membrane peptidoglycan carboxypeptidase